MKQLSYFTLCFCLLLTFSTVAAAQEKIEITPSAPPPPFTPFPVVKKVGQAKVRFNKLKNETIAETPFLRVIGSAVDGIGLTARFASSGKKVRKPENITLSILPAAKDRTYVDDRTIKIFTDEKQVLSSTSELIGAESDGQVIIAAIKQNIPYKVFVKMSKAKQIKMQIGPTEFELQEIDIEGFRDLLKTIEE